MPTIKCYFRTSVVERDASQREKKIDEAGTGSGSGGNRPPPVPVTHTGTHPHSTSSSSSSLPVAHKSPPSKGTTTTTSGSIGVRASNGQYGHMTPPTDNTRTAQENILAKNKDKEREKEKERGTSESDTARMLSALNPSSSSADKISAARELRHLVRTADDTYWTTHCPQVICYALDLHS